MDSCIIGKEKDMTLKTHIKTLMVFIKVVIKSISTRREL